MKLDTTYRFVIFMAFAVFLASCQNIVITVDSIPSNTPSGEPIYIVGNFNNWDPGDERYRMQFNDDSTYSVVLPPGFGTIEYKFTRGDWTRVEKDICGYETGNRRAVIGDQDTVNEQVESWNDLDPLNCPRLTLLLKNIPENTPEEDIIAIAGNFNSWAVDSSSELSVDQNGNYSITIDRPPQVEEIEFKLTRGDLANAESDEFGNMIPNRILRFGVRDTIEIEVQGWIDQPTDRSKRVVILIDGLPANTPASDDIYLSSSMNGWDAGDKNYIFQSNRKGQLFFPVPRKNKPLEFKLTRGDWHAVEVDRFGFEINNRYLDLVNTDTLRVIVHGWKDLSYKSDHEVTIIIDEVPANTPDEDIYITGNINGWRPNHSGSRFQALPSGEFVANIPRGRGDLAFKITRGSWDNAEVDEYGSDFSNRVYSFQDLDTLYIGIQNWKDLPPYSMDEVTLVINKLPENTPQSDNLFLAPDFNGWNPGDPKLVFYYLPDGRPYITFPVSGRTMQYKISRGNWETVEVAESGHTINDRTMNYGFSDTVFIEVVGWRDVIGAY